MNFTGPGPPDQWTSGLLEPCIRPLAQPSLNQLHDVHTQGYSYKCRQILVLGEIYVKCLRKIEHLMIIAVFNIQLLQ